MTRKHFEELAKMIARLHERQGSVFNDEHLLNLLIDELSDFCYDQNNRFSFSRFRNRVLELVHKG